MGLLTGMVVYPIISPSKRHRLIVWVLRLAAIPLAVILFVVLIRNFYTSNPYAGMYDIDGVSRSPVSHLVLCQYSLFGVSVFVLHSFKPQQPM